jgi:hypothetical protein
MVAAVAAALPKLRERSAVQVDTNYTSDKYNMKKRKFQF